MRQFSVYYRYLLVVHEAVRLIKDQPEHEYAIFQYCRTACRTASEFSEHKKAEHIFARWFALQRILFMVSTFTRAAHEAVSIQREVKDFRFLDRAAAQHEAVRVRDYT